MPGQDASTYECHSVSTGTSKKILPVGPKCADITVYSQVSYGALGVNESTLPSATLSASTCHFGVTVASYTATCAMSSGASHASDATFTGTSSSNGSSAFNDGHFATTGYESSMESFIS